MSSSSNNRSLVAATLVLAVAGTFGQTIETNETGPAANFRPQPAPVPRSLSVNGSFAGGPDVILPALDPGDVVGVGDTNPMVNGRVYEWNVGTDTGGEWFELADGGRLWTFAVQSPNATGLRIRIEPFAPPKGSGLIVYNPTNPAEAAGPYGAAQAIPGVPLWTARISGRDARIEWYVPAELVRSGNYGSLEITGFVQIFPDPPAPRGQGCRLDVTCHPEWQTTAQSVAHYDFVQGGESFICSGAMINRSPVADLCPLFLTAAHCIETPGAAASMNIFWFFQTSTCDGPAPSLNSLPRTDGATLLRRDTDSDTCLLGLPVNDIPNGIIWAGWSSAEAPDPTPATLIHHPLGMRKSWSPGSLLGIETVSQCLTTASDTYDFELTNGGQDGGSSGAPVFDNANHRIRAVATCSESDDCIPDEDTGEGSFASGFTNMSPYLVAQNDVWVQSGWLGGENGSSGSPFNTLLEGWYAVRGGGTLHLRPGFGYPAMDFTGPRGMTLTAEGGTVRIGG